MLRVENEKSQNKEITATQHKKKYVNYLLARWTFCIAAAIGIILTQGFQKTSTAYTVYTSTSKERRLLIP